MAENAGISEIEELPQTQESDAAGGDLLDQYLKQENYERILQAIRQLDEIYRIVFEYKYLHELSDQEIAELLGVTSKVVNVRISGRGNCRIPCDRRPD